MSATTIEKTIFIKGSPQQVWAFLTQSDNLAQWYHRSDTDLVEGEDYTLGAESSDGPQVWGHVVKMQPYSLLKTTFCIGPFGDKESLVTWRLEEAAGGTKLSLTHENIAEASGDSALHLLSALDAGWDAHLGQLRANINA